MRRSAFLHLVVLVSLWAGCSGESESKDGDDPCAEGRSLCRDHGDCVVDGGSYTCSCDEGYAGEDCGGCAAGYFNPTDDALLCVEGEYMEPECPEDYDCGENGFCYVDLGTPGCACNEGWSGDRCETFMCQDEGTVEVPPGSGTCVPDLCDETTCDGIENAVAGSCFMQVPTTWQCECEEGFVWNGEALPPACEAL